MEAQKQMNRKVTKHLFLKQVNLMDKRFMSHDQALETTTAINQLPANGDCAYKCDSQSE